MLTHRLRARWLAPLLAAQLLVLAPYAAAQVAGEVEFSRGVGFAQTAGQAPRTLGKGLELKEGDRLTTSDGGSAVIKLQDGTRMTVRPNSELVLQQYQFKENAPDNTMLMQLVRGGFRAVTGLISKGSPNAARVQTNTATIGIRGTDFDARVCQRDCAQESSKIDENARPNAPLASAKLVQSSGEIYATDPAGTRRRVVDGGGVYPGDVIETARGASGMLVFRDDSRVTLGSQTRFRVDNFVYDDKNAGDGRFLASVLRGSVRALTGLIAKANTRNVGFSTATATIGIRGTGLDIVFDPDSNRTDLYAWLGSITMQAAGGAGGGSNALQVLTAGQGLFITPTGIQSIANVPSQTSNVPRPDQAPPPPANLFSTSSQVNENQEGLFVFVRDGHIEIVSTKEILQLGKDEAGFASNTGDVGRPATIPKFIDFDKIQLPNSKASLLTSVLSESVKTDKQCK